MPPSETLLELTAGDYRLTLSPHRGGSIAGFWWRDKPLMRPTSGTSILDAACFPLVPFSNRIANGRFQWEGTEVCLAPNFPGRDHPHPLHGFGWLLPWTVTASDPGSAVLEHRWHGGEWPWPYRADQRFALRPDGLTIELALTNTGDRAMPAGIGLHPFFPCAPDTRYRGLHRGEWRNTADCLPVSLDERDAPHDWWEGAPVSSREVDTAYTDRAGVLDITWPDRDLRLTIACSPSLAHTVVYTPAGAGWFCVEPVSHTTDAVNSGRGDAGIVRLPPGATLHAAAALHADTL